MNPLVPVTLCLRIIAFTIPPWRVGNPNGNYAGWDSRPDKLNLDQAGPIKEFLT